jgi:hypothetical protein
MEKTFYEEIKVKGKDLVDKIKNLVHEGNVRRIILKDEHGNTYLEIPLNIAAVGVLAAPLLAALGAIAALVANCTLVVERSAEKKDGGSSRDESTPR